MLADPTITPAEARLKCLRFALSRRVALLNAAMSDRDDDGEPIAIPVSLALAKEAGERYFRWAYEAGADNLATRLDCLDLAGEISGPEDYRPLEDIAADIMAWANDDAGASEAAA